MQFVAAHHVVCHLVKVFGALGGNAQAAACPVDFLFVAQLFDEFAVV